MKKKNRKFNPLPNLLRSSVPYCPICFDAKPYLVPISAYCNHAMCETCLSDYIRIVVQSDLWSIVEFVNPFRCPMTGCPVSIDIETTVYKYITKPELQVLERWTEERRHPPAKFLSLCPRKNCRQTRCTMHYNSPGEDETIVYCTACNAKYCELCLYRYPTAKSRDAVVDKAHNCGKWPTAGLLKVMYAFAGSVTVSKEQIPTKYDKYRPWLPVYAMTRFDTNSLADWSLHSWMTKSKAQVCPECQTVIEKIEGCNHMTCLICGCEFHYCCGKRYDEEHWYRCGYDVDDY